MDFSITIQLTQFQNLDSRGRDDGPMRYGYRIYSDTGHAEYSNAYDTVEELLDDIDEDTVLDFIKENHPTTYDIIEEEGGYYFNDEKVRIDDEDRDDDDDDEDEFVINIEHDSGVEEVLEEAAQQLIQ